MIVDTRAILAYLGLMAAIIAIAAWRDKGD